MKELSELELREIDGGVFWLIPIVVGLAIAGVIADWPGFKKGITTGFNDGDY